MSSVRAVRVSGSGPVLVTTAVKVKVPPGSGRLDGWADFSTMIDGMPARVTVASSEAVTWLLSLSAARTVTMSVWVAPTAPVNVPVNERGGELAPGARNVRIRVLQLEPGRGAARSP